MHVVVLSLSHPHYLLYKFTNSSLVLFSKDTYVGQCIWRSNNNSLSTQMSERYATCSPDLNFCPDYTCDELERLDARICPQDCTIECK